MACQYENLNILALEVSTIIDQPKILSTLEKYIDVGDGVRFDGVPKITFTKISTLGIPVKIQPIFDEFIGCISVGSNCYVDSTNATAFHSPQTKITCVKLLDNLPGQIRIGRNVKLLGVAIISYGWVSIGDNSIISAMTTIMDCDGHPLTGRSSPDEAAEIIHLPVVIGKNVWIGINCTILKGVKIGDNCVIGAHSVVSRDMPANSVISGNPARVMKSILS